MTRGRGVLASLLGLILTAAGAQGAAGDLDTGFGVDRIFGPGKYGPGIAIVDTDAPSDYVNAHGLALQSDGKILAVLGEGPGMYRFLPSGLPDPDFGFGPFVADGYVSLAPYRELRDVAVQPDGRIVAVGVRQGIDVPQNMATVVRLLSDGSLDPSFGAGGFVDPPSSSREELLAVTLQGDGKILAAGRLRNLKERFVVRRLLGDGTADRDFGAGGKMRVRADLFGGYPLEILLRGDGRTVAVGRSFNGSGGDYALVGLDAAGRRDRSFGQRGRVLTGIEYWDVGFGAALQSDGKVVVAGTSAPFGGEESFVLLRYLEDGSLDPDFGAGGVVVTDFGDEGEAYAVAIQPDGKIVAAGGAEHAVALARYLSDGTLDSSFGAGGLVTTPIVGIDVDYAEALAVVLQADGRIVIAGAACKYATVECHTHFLARYEGD